MCNIKADSVNRNNVNNKSNPTIIQILNSTFIDIRVSYFVFILSRTLCDDYLYLLIV